MSHTGNASGWGILRTARWAQVGLVGVAAMMLLPAPNSAHASSTEAEPTSDTAVDTVLLQMKIHLGDRELVHPGHMAEVGLEHILELTETKGGETRTHQVVVALEAVEDGGFRAKVVYKDNGRAVVEGTTQLPDRKWAKVQKGSKAVSLRVDSSAKHPDEIEIGGGNNPLDGI